MLTLYGVAVTAENARHLIATLILDGSPDALAAAEMTNKGVDRELYAVALTPAMRDAILAVLEDPADGLDELRCILARDHRDRQALAMDSECWEFRCLPAGMKIDHRSL